MSMSYIWRTSTFDIHARKGLLDRDDMEKCQTTKKQTHKQFSVITKCGRIHLASRIPIDCQNTQVTQRVIQQLQFQTTTKIGTHFVALTKIKGLWLPNWLVWQASRYRMGAKGQNFLGYLPIISCAVVSRQTKVLKKFSFSSKFLEQTPLIFSQLNIIHYQLFL